MSKPIKILTKTQREVLEILANSRSHDTDDILCEGRECWVGPRRISMATVNALNRVCLLHREDSSQGCERFTINSFGRRALEDESVILTIHEAMRTNRPITL